MEYKEWLELLNEVVYRISKREDIILVEGFIGLVEVHLVSQSDFDILKEHMYFTKSTTMDNVYSILTTHQVIHFRKK